MFVQKKSLIFTAKSARNEVKTRYGQIIYKSISHHPRRPKYLDYQEQKAAGIVRL